MPQEVISYLPLVAVAAPLIAFILVICAPEKPVWRHTWSVLGALGTLVAVVMMFPILAGGNVIVLRLPMVITPLDLAFRVDFLSFFIALIASFIWLMSTIFAVDYMNHEGNRGRFFAFFLLTLTGTVGVPLAGDLLSLLVFFELMSLASYVLVVHTQTKEAYDAGNLYLYLGVFGGMCLLTGIGLIYYFAGSLDLTHLLALPGALNGYTLAAGIFLITGFAIKAGMFPLHIWLPKAHPVAPSPASALLSGIMIKTGAYGMIRTINLLYTPEAGAALENTATSLWQLVSSAGFAIIWFGIITMFFGAFVALLQNNIKKLLACSSISQIGYIIMGIGAAAYLGHEGAMGLAGSVYHVLNHAFFKSTLFLSAGAIVYLTGELNMDNLGGLKNKLPFTTIVVFIASLGIVGMPFFNGYASKTLLHHSIVEAFEHHNVYSLYIAEKIFTLTSAGTVCYFIKFLYFTFWRPAPSGLVVEGKEPLLMKIGMGVLAIIMLAIGLSPNFMLNQLVLPTLGSFNLNAQMVSGLSQISFWHLGDIGAIAIALLLGAAFFFVAHRTQAYRFQIPHYLGADFFGRQAARLAIFLWSVITWPFVILQNALRGLSKVVYDYIFGLLQNLDYKPGDKRIFRSINIGNIDFDMFLILFSFCIILIVVFIIRFGVEIF